MKTGRSFGVKNERFTLKDLWDREKSEMSPEKEFYSVICSCSIYNQYVPKKISFYLKFWFDYLKIQTDFTHLEISNNFKKILACTAMLTYWSRDRPVSVPVLSNTVPLASLLRPKASSVPKRPLNSITILKCFMTVLLRFIAVFAFLER